MRKLGAASYTTLYSSQAAYPQWTSIQVDIGALPADFNIHIYSGTTNIDGNNFEDFALDNVSFNLFFNYN